MRGTPRCQAGWATRTSGHSGCHSAALSGHQSGEPVFLSAKVRLLDLSGGKTRQYVPANQPQPRQTAICHLGRNRFATVRL